MGTKWRRSHRDKGPWKTDRRRKALTNLETQLSTNTKVDKEGATVNLDDKDVKRIKKEIEILKPKV